MYGVLIFWMSVSKEFMSGSQELSNKFSWVSSAILYFNYSNLKVSKSLISMKLPSALNSASNEDNLDNYLLQIKMLR